jgi:cytochrome b561
MLLIKDTRTRFGLISVLLHWYVAIAVLGILIPTGLLIYFIGPHGALRPLRADITFFHQSIALTSIPFFLARIFWRAANGKPKTYIQHPVLTFGAEVSWRLLLILIVWQMLTGPFIEQLNWFGLVDLGRINYPDALSWVSDNVETLHLYGALAIATVLFFHVGGALRHHFIVKDSVLRNMLWPVVPDAPANETQPAAARPVPEVARGN